jgi:hypothetical protein
MFQDGWLNMLPGAPSPEAIDDPVLSAALAVVAVTHGDENYDQVAWPIVVGADRELMTSLGMLAPFVSHIMFGFADPEIDEVEGGPAIVVEVDVEGAGIGPDHPAVRPRIEPVGVSGTDVNFQVVVR